MKILLILFLTLNLLKIQAQDKIHRINVTLNNSLYSYGEGSGYLNNVVRFDEGFGITYKSFNTLKKRGMIYELLFDSRTAYYDNILSNNNKLEVSDFYLNTNLIFPVYTIRKKIFEHWFSAGLGASFLVERDYLDNENNILPYDNSQFKEIKAGKHKSFSFILDYSLDINFSKKIGGILGIRYSTNSFYNDNSTPYIPGKGTDFSMRYGVFYQF